MLRLSLFRLKISKVEIPAQIGSLAYTHDYRKPVDFNLAKRFGKVNEKNRYEALEIIFGEKLDGYVGRRQYKLQSAGQMQERVVEPLKSHGIDWHDLKGLGRQELLDVCDLLQLDASMRTLFLTAIESKMCGVLTRSGKDRNPRTICTRPGRLQHGWRCGVKGHTHDAFFEGKLDAIPSELAAVRSQGFLGLSSQQRQMLLETSSMAAAKGSVPLRLPRGPTSLNSPALTGKSTPVADATQSCDSDLASKPTNASLFANLESAKAKDTSTGEKASRPAEEDPEVVVRMENGIQVEHRKAPDFSIVGRYQERQILNPRVWTSPSNPIFNVGVVGIEMRVHPDDPRTVPQIVKAHTDWELHCEACKHVVWEMLELYGVERLPQPLDMEEGELGEPDSIFSFSSAFWGSTAEINEKKGDCAESQSQEGVIRPADVAIERRMVTEDGESVPWFTPPLPQNFKDGVPFILPYAPTIIIRAVYRQVTEVVSLNDVAVDDTMDPASKRKALLEKTLHYPLLDISVLKHPDACFWWNAEDEEKAIGHILNCARKVPFALPFNMYIRVDPSRALRRHHSSEKRKSAEEQSESAGVSCDMGPLSEAFTSDFYLEIKRREEEKKKYFDLLNFRASAWMAADPKGGVMGVDYSYTDADGGSIDRTDDSSEDEEAPPAPLFGTRVGGKQSGVNQGSGPSSTTTSRGSVYPSAFDEEVAFEEESHASTDEGDSPVSRSRTRTAEPSFDDWNSPIEGAPKDDDGDDDINPAGWK